MESRPRGTELDPYALKLIRFKAEQLIGLYGLVEADRDDVEQDLTIDLRQRLPRFDPTRASFRTFVSRVVEHAAATIIERRQAPMRDWSRCTRSLNDPVEDDEGNRAELGDLMSDDRHLTVSGQGCPPVAEQAALRADLERLRAALPPELREVMDGLKASQTVIEIANHLGVHRDTVNEHRKRLRELAAELGLRDHLK